MLSVSKQTDSFHCRQGNEKYRQVMWRSFELIIFHVYLSQIMASDDPDLPVVHKIQQDKIFWNLKHFHRVMSHLEERE